MNDKIAPPTAVPEANVLVLFMDWPGLTLGNAAIVSQSFASRPDLVSCCTKTFEAEINPAKEEKITADIPDATDTDLQNLDERGLVLPGVTVRRKDILIGLARLRKKTDLSAEDRLLRLIFGEKAALYKDISVRMPYCDPGRIANTYLSEDKQSATVEVLIERPLTVGDILEDAQGNRIVIAAVLPDEQMPFPEQYQKRPEMVLKPLYAGTIDCATMWFKKIGLLVENKIHGRSVGPYDSITGISLADESGWQKGAAINEYDLRCLIEAGALNIVRELMACRSSGDANIIRLYEAILCGENLPEPQTPELIKTLFTVLKGLGIKIETTENELQIGFASTDDILEWSWGEVTRDGTIDGRSLKPFPAGLFSEKIFGPLNDWHCACGKYDRIKYKGIVCQKCGVEIAKAKVKRERMGHINLAIPVFHPLCLTKKLQAIPVIPPDLRPIVGTNPIKAMHELNDYYRRIILCNDHFREMENNDAPDNILEKAETMLQDAVDELFVHILGCNAFAGGEPIAGLASHIFRSIWWDGMTDFSGQGVLIPDPCLRSDQCGLPIPLAMEIFKPMVMRQLVERGFAHNALSARRIIDKKKSEAFEALDEIASKYVVLAYYRSLNSSQLPRSKMYAFWVKLTDGEAISLSPDACRQFGAEIQGEMLDIFLPVYPAAQEEARKFIFPAIDFPCYEFPFSDEMAPVQSALLFENWPIEDFLAELRHNLRKSGETKKTLPLSELDKLLFHPLGKLPTQNKEDVFDLPNLKT